MWTLQICWYSEQGEDSRINPSFPPLYSGLGSKPDHTKECFDNHKGNLNFFGTLVREQESSESKKL